MKISSLPLDRQTDCHIHSLVSDGDATPEAIVQTAAGLKLRNISITDHDAVGAYRNSRENIFRRAAKAGIRLCPGIELDCIYRGREVHLLGYGIDPEHPSLIDYLDEIQNMRKIRAREIIYILRKKIPGLRMPEKGVFHPRCDTWMKPHIIGHLLQEKVFTDYGEAKRWIRDHVKSPFPVEKPSLETASQLIHDAGGVSLLAHPGFIFLDGDFHDEAVFCQTLVDQMVSREVDGVEFDYPYPPGTLHREKIFRKNLFREARKAGILVSRGTDAHSLEELEKRNR